MGFEVLTEVKIKIPILSDVTLKMVAGGSSEIPMYQTT
jgi:hypothetical protein